MKALILCAGLGTRLRPLTEHWPKCGVPLLGQPLFRYNLALLKGAGVCEVGINVHYLPDEMERIARKECERAEMKLTVSREPSLLGTGGALRAFRGWLGDEPFVVLNGDVLFALELRPLFERHVNEGRVATMVLMPMPPNEKFSSVDIDGRERVRRIAGRGPATASESLTPLHFASVQLLSPGIFDFISPSGSEEIFTDIYARFWNAGGEVHGERVEGAYWADLGTPRRYLNAAFDLLEGRVPLELFPNASPFEGEPTPILIGNGSQISPRVRLEAPLFVGAGVVVPEGCELSRSTVFEGTLLGSDERLRETVAWKGGRLNLS